jgi:hypothetical protein
MRVFTVASVSYLPMASLLFESLRTHHPELTPTLLIPDVTRAGLEGLRKEGADALAKLLCVEDLGFDFLEAARIYYSALEFCSALKVLGTAHILKTESDCLFLDPDMVVMQRLDGVLQAQDSILVTPHVLAPLPEDGLAPDDLEMCGSGFVNGGVFRARAGAPALPWLVSKARGHWFVAQQLGMYADQLWLSALPFLFPQIQVLRDPTINVAYWNLHERPLRRDGATLRLASGEAVKLFHFSGFSRPSGGRLTKHSQRRYDPMTEEIVALLVADYEAKLNAASARWGHLRGDIAFNTDPLPMRLERAAGILGDARLRPPKAGFGARLRALFGG